MHSRGGAVALWRPREAMAGSGGLVALIAVLATFLAASTVPTPFYGVDAARWHLSPSNITLAFGVYALVLLLALLVFGRLSDHIGRRPVLLVGIALQAAGVGALLGAGGFGALLAGRLLQGIATGFAIGAISAAILDADARRGPVANSAAPLAGSAVGALIAAAVIQAIAHTDWIVYVLLLMVLLVEAVLVLRLPETSTRRPGALASLRPSAGLPRSARGAFLSAAPVVFAVYALSGLFASLGPALTKELTGSDSVLLGVLPLVLMNVTAPLTSVLIRHRPAPQALVVGLVGLVAGVVLAAAGVVTGSVALLLLGAAVSGIGFGAGFRGGQQMIVGAAPEEDHAGTISVVYIVSYLGFGAPAIVAGAVDSVSGDIRGTALGYCGVLLLLALAAAAALLHSSRTGGGAARA